LSPEIPQVRVDYVGMAKKATNFLYDRFNLPIALFIEPFNCHYSYETFDGYLQAVSKLPQKQTILYNCSNNDATDQLTCLLESSMGKFSILTTDTLYSSIKKTLQQAGKDLSQYPILVMGNTKRVPEEDHKKIFLMSTQAEQLALRAAESLLELIEHKREGIYEELSEDILKP
jgi:DNA-binding LacI/PurR family transcriptional regulator